MAKKKQKRFIYTREQGGEQRYYGDFRSFSDVGGRREALIPHGADRATTDPLLAQALYAERIADLESRRRRRVRNEPEEDTHLASYSVHHLRKKRLANKVSGQWLESAEKHLLTAIEFFCNKGRPLPQDGSGDPILTGIADRELSSIGVTDIQEYAEWLSSLPNRRGERLSQSSQRKYLNSLSNLFRRAVSEGRVPPAHNPVAGLMEKPQDRAGRAESKWLEVPDAALLLEAARLYKPKRPDIAISPRVVYGVIATLLLTGGRPDEVYGLQVEDISVERRKVTFRPNATRARLKTGGSTRTLNMWPQLEEILGEYLADSDSPKSGLLFPNRDGEKIKDIRKALDAVATLAGWAGGEIRPYAFRHTYTAARLQTLDNGHPVSEYTVARELGHGGAALVRSVYGHLGEVRHRSDQVEYRIEQHMARLATKLAKLRDMKAA
jgi:integrase